MPKSTYDVPLAPSVDPLAIPTSGFGTLQTLSVIPSLVTASKYGILRLGVKPLSMLPS